MISHITNKLVLAGLLLAAFAPAIVSAADSPDPYANETPG